MGKVLEFLLNFVAGSFMILFSIFMAVGVPILVVAMGVGLYENWSTKDETSLSQSTTFEKEARQEFMDGCDDGTSTEFCGCMWREITEVASLDQLASDGLQLTEQEIQQKYASQIEYCYQIYANTGVN